MTHNIFRKIVALTAAAALLSGCGQAAPLPPSPELTLPPPTPAGMTELSPRVAPLPDPADEDCDRTASLRPFPDAARAAKAVENIRNRGRLIVGLDIGSNLFSFRDPITGGVAGFDVDIAGEVARDIFGTPTQRRDLVNFSTVYLTAYQRILAPRDSPITAAQDLSGRRVCVVPGTTSLERVQQISPAPVIVSVVTWADCLVAIQQRQVDAVSTDDTILAGLVAQDPYLHIVGPTMSQEPYGIGVNLTNTGLVRFVNATLARIRADGTWNRLYRKWLSVLGPAPAPPIARYVD